MHSLHRGEKFTARRTGPTQLDFVRRTLTQHQRSDQKFDARPTGSTQSRTGMMQPDFLGGIDAAPAVQ
ncbi:hypothetical protein NDU88_002914 [Pleurodeles waltl]|uniref:Uncharacterized protein n=1 Tax=Pleurodeles waltl TaxID=8319 RepID=A0AAV7KW27_PLEWA|nr:hypothetical protein NDU88_002914 [Pleurodeles waltl]